MEPTPPSKPRTITAPVIIAIVLLIVTAVTFFVVLLTFAPNGEDINAATAEAEYGEIVARLISIGDASRAEPLLQTYSCVACHRLSGSQIAPSWETLLEVAPERRPPLTTEEYIYESITHPSAYIVEGYPASMPQDYATRLSEQDLADILVYLVNGGT